MATCLCLNFCVVPTHEPITFFSGRKKSAGPAGSQFGAMSQVESYAGDTASIGASSKVTMANHDNLREKFDFRLKPNEQRQQLPVFQCRNQLIEKTEAYPVTVVSGATGCG